MGCANRKVVALAANQAMPRALLEQGQQLVLAHAGHRRQDRQREAVAEQRRQPEHVPARLAELRDPAEDGDADLIGQPQIRGSGRRDEIAALLLDRPLTQEVVEDLLHEQRIAAGRLAHGGGELMRRPGQTEAGDELVDVGLVQPLERHEPTDLLPSNPADQAGQPILGLDRSIRPDDEERHRLSRRQVGDGEHQVVEQIQREPVGPVEIVEDDEQRAALGELDAGLAHRDEELQLLVVGLVRHGRTRRGRPARPMQEPPDRVQAVPEPLPDLRGSLLELRQQRFDERQVRQREILVAAAEADLHPAALAGRPHLLQEPRLADPGVTVDKDDTRPALDGLLEPVTESPQLVDTVHQRGNTRQHGREALAAIGGQLAVPTAHLPDAPAAGGPG